MKIDFSEIITKIKNQQYALCHENRAVVNANGHYIYLADNGKYLAVRTDLSERFRESIGNIYEGVQVYDVGHNYIAPGQSRHTVNPASPSASGTDNLCRNFPETQANPRIPDIERGIESGFPKEKIIRNDETQIALGLAAKEQWQEVSTILGFCETKSLYNDEGTHLIHIAAQKPTAANVLLTLADTAPELLNICDKTGETPVSIAEKSGHNPETIRTLLSAAANSKKILNGPAKKEPENAIQTIANPDYREFHEQVLEAATDNDIDKIRKLYADKPEHEFLPKYGSYDHVAVIVIMDDGNRLKRAIKQYPEGYKADLFLWWNQANKEESAKDYFFEDHLITTKKKLTANSKLIISSHGDTIKNIGSEIFAQKIHQWLTNYCYEAQTPRITLASCSIGSESDTEDQDSSFAMTMLQELGRLKRWTAISCSASLLLIDYDGSEMAIKGEVKISSNGKRVIEVAQWQGGDEWLVKERQYKHGLLKMSEANRVTSLIKVYISSPEHETVRRDKYDIQGIHGLHSIIPIQGDCPRKVPATRPKKNESKKP